MTSHAVQIADAEAEEAVARRIRQRLRESDDINLLACLCWLACRLCHPSALGSATIRQSGETEADCARRRIGKAMAGMSERNLTVFELAVGAVLETDHG